MLLILIVWLIIFSARLVSIGGFDPNYRDSEAKLLKPLQITLDHQISLILPEQQSALLSGMLLGVSGAVPYKLKQQLQQTSTIHLLVVSGSNLSLVAAFLTKALMPLGRLRGTVLTILAIIGYSVLTGLGVPVIRAAIMSIFSLSGQLIGRESTSWWIIILSAGLMLLWQPNWLYSISFQLSFLATIGAVVAAPKLDQLIKFVPNLIRSDLSVSLAAQLLTLPIIAYNFQQLSLVGVVVNCLVLWIVSPVMIIGAAAVLVSFLNLTLGQVVGVLPNILLTYFVEIVQFFAGLPSSWMSLSETFLVVWAGYYLLLISLFMIHLKHDQTAVD